MQGLAVVDSIVHGLDVDLVFKELAVFDLLAHLGEDLEHHAACADIGVTYLTVAHLTLRQTHVQPGGGQGAGGVLCKETIQIGGIGLGDSIALACGAQAIAVEYQKNSFFTHFVITPERLPLRWWQSQRA